MMAVRRLIVIAAMVFFCCLTHARAQNPPTSAAGEPPGPQPNSLLPLIACQTSGGNFWMDGQPPDLAWPSNLVSPKKQKQLVLWGSWCGGGERTASLTLGPFRAPTHFSMLVSGMPFDRGDVLKLVRVSDGAQIIVTHDTPGHVWKQMNLIMPVDWVGVPIEIFAADTSLTPEAWIGLSEPFTIGAHGGINPLWQNRKAGLKWHRWLIDLLKPVGLILVVVNLIGIAGYSILRRFVRTESYMAPLLIAAVTVLAGYLTFWSYFIGPRTGQDWVWAITSSAVLYILFCLFKRNVSVLPREDWKELKYPLLLVVIAALFNLGMLWIPRVEGITMDELAARRPTTWALPSDNILQEWLGALLRTDADPRGMNAEWTSSDRPPLEAGVQLLSGPLLCDALQIPWKSNAQLGGMLFQLTWIYGLWALLRAMGCAPRAASQIILCLIPTPFLYLNSIFVWPKLSAAALALGMTAILCFRGTRRLTLGESAVAGALLSLAMLCHSGIFFYALPVLGLWFILPSPAGRPGWRAGLILVALSGSLFFPWTCYQKFFDPPGNHLLKLSFAGVIDSNSRPVSESIRIAYRALSWHTIMEYKLENFATPFKGSWTNLFLLFPSDRFASRLDNFLYLFRSFGVFLLGFLALPVLLLPRHADSRRPVMFLLSALVLSLILWCLLMLGPGTTIIHAGAYGVPLVFLALLAYALRMLHPAALLLVGVYNLAQFLWVYCWTYPYPPLIDKLAVAVLILSLLLAALIYAFASSREFEPHRHPGPGTN